MTGQDITKGDERPPIRVIDSEVRDTAWQELDLSQVFRFMPKLPAGPGVGAMGLSAAASASIVSYPQTGRALVGVVTREPLKHIPVSAFVSIGRSSNSPVARHRARGVRRFANDNHAKPHQNSLWRDLFFLAVLAATVFGAFWSGRVHGQQKVIVVPAPLSHNSVIT